MRKKGDNTVLGTTAAASCGIAKKTTTARSSRAAEAPSASPTVSTDARNANRNASPAATASDCNGSHTTEGEYLASNPASREASATPVESDLLRYLSAHIAPRADATHAASPDSITSFEIGRDEYLQGVLRLVKSDCPEVMHDMPGFVAAMQNAFAHVYNESRSQA
jgi:hypothetical protein